MGQFSTAEQDRYYNARGLKRTGAATFLFSPVGKLLIVKPSYKDGWSLVGGVGGNDKSPLETAIAEIHEEIGIALAPSRLTFAGIRYVRAKGGRNEETQTYFTGQLTEQEIADIKLDPKEIETCEFVELKELEQNKEYRSHDRMQAVIEALPAVLSHAPFYLEGEEMIS